MQLPVCADVNSEGRTCAEKTPVRRSRCVRQGSHVTHCVHTYQMIYVNAEQILECQGKGARHVASKWCIMLCLPS